MAKVTAGRDQLGEFAPEFAHLNDDVLFGEVWAREDKLSPKLRILILNGSARAHGNTSTLTAAFKRGAEEAGNDVVELPVGRMAIRGCLGCEYCHGRGHGECIIRDDEKEVKEEMKKADMLVLASPIYFFSPSAQLEAAIQRMHAEGIPDNIRESAMILTSVFPGVYDAAKAQ